MWECAWRQQRKTNPGIYNFLNDQDIQDPLNSLNAFFGGRTNAVRLHFTAEPEMKIRYYDYTSLYPWVNKNGRYPTGHPTFIYAPTSNDLTPYFGLAKVTILPPESLFHPVLPVRLDGKLTFPLCRTCTEHKINEPLTTKSYECPHSNTERQLIGTCVHQRF